MITTETEATSYVHEFRDQGFTVVRGFFSKEETKQFLNEVERCAREDETAASLTDNGITYTGKIFLRSEFVQQKLADQRLIDFLRPIAGDNLWITMDQAVSKEPGAGIFRWHQDNGYTGLKTEHFQLWVALTETTQQNGALKLAPGSHKRGVLPHKYITSGQVEVQAPIGAEVCIDATAGDVILFSSLMLHATGPNEADRRRLAYVAEYMPLSDYAFGVGASRYNPPYFIVAEDGKSNPHFVNRQPGAMSLRNQMLYLGPRVKHTAKTLLRPIRSAVRAVLP
jgi:ectoine hydroxylase-related dioxygenase (phytanoyl-CoA dioxygenase family)